MSGLSKFFELTDDRIHDRHHYRLIHPDGSSTTFDNWLDTHATWFRLPHQFKTRIEVLDKPPSGQDF